jgi:NAD(P)-dependent dehydrogenase (short-subunit alcohol dehydrogenase family)
MMWDYTDKTAVVTGAASGMGAALTRLLVADGARVHAIDRNAVGAPAEASYRVDLADPSSVGEALERLPGSVDAVFNCAGLSIAADPELVLKVNYLGLRRLTEGLIPRLAAGAAVASVASKAGQIWPAHLPALLDLIAITDPGKAETALLSTPAALENAYGYSKAAVVVYTFGRAAELIDRGIRMNCTLPGNTDTPMFRDDFMAAMPEAMKALSALTRREATPEEQASVLMFLNSSAASWVNGVALVVDGGSLAGVTAGRFQPPALPAYTSGDGSK